MWSLISWPRGTSWEMIWAKRKGGCSRIIPNFQRVVSLYYNTNYYFSHGCVIVDNHSSESYH